MQARAAMETQTYNAHTEEITAINEQTGDANAEIVAAINAQRRDTRENNVTTHSKDLDVQSHSSDSSNFTDFDEEEIPTEITDVILR